MMFKPPTKFGFLAFTLALACSDDDGAGVQRKGPIIVMGGSGGDGGSAGGDAGPGGAAGAAGSAGSSGSAGSGGAGGSGGVPCVPVGLPDAGDLDASADGGGDASSDGGALPRLVSFAADVYPIVSAKCGPCHVTISYGGHNVGSPDVDAAYADALELGRKLYDRVNGGGMPPPEADEPNNCPSGALPGTPGCLSVAEVELIGTWLAQCSPR